MPRQFQGWSTNFRTARNFAASANTYTKVDTSISKLKTVGFFAAIDLVPVLTTTPNIAKMNGPEEKPNNLGVWTEISGPTGYSAMVFMNMNSAGKLTGTEKR